MFAVVFTLHYSAICCAHIELLCDAHTENDVQGIQEGCVINIKVNQDRSRWNHSDTGSHNLRCCRANRSASCCLMSAGWSVSDGGHAATSQLPTAHSPQLFPFGRMEEHPDLYSHANM